MEAAMPVDVKTAPLVQQQPTERPLRKGEATRERLLAITERAVLSKGFSATSIDEIIAEAEITKSGFFYHFRDKNELALAVLERYIAMDAAQVEQTFARAAELSDDPLQRVLIMLKLYAEFMDSLSAVPSGCVAATLAYEESQFDRRVRERMLQASIDWQRSFRSILEVVAERYPLRDDVDLDAVADFCSASVQGAIVIAKMRQDTRVMGEQVMILRSYLKLLFDRDRDYPGAPS
jgi:TetR/AcrR family transcriptional regulator, transcriptional repressor for nem operon